MPVKILIIAVIALLFGLCVRKIILDMKKGGCSGNCAGCSGSCSGCHSCTASDKEKQN